MAKLAKRTAEVPRGHRPQEALCAQRSGEDGQGPRQGQVRRDRRGRDEPGRRSAPRRPDGPRRGQPAQRHRQNVRVAVFAKDAKAEEARKAGADIVGAEDLVAAVQDGNIDFDRVIATPDMMPLVGRLGQDPRPAQPDAEPQGRHGDARTSPARSRPPRAAPSSSASKRPASSTPASARPRSPRPRCSRTSRRSPMR